MEKLSSLINGRDASEPEAVAAHFTPTRGRRQLIPETPEHEQIRRDINLHLTRRKYIAASRIVEAKKLETSIRKHVEPLYIFLRAARKDPLTFPIPALQLWEDLVSVRRALDGVENLLSGNADLEATEPDSVSGDADETRVG